MKSVQYYTSNELSTTILALIFAKAFVNGCLNIIIAYCVLASSAYIVTLQFFKVDGRSFL